MELIGSILLVLAVGLLVAMFVARPFLQASPTAHKRALDEVERSEHERSSLLAERDRVLTALQELDFDFALGKVPADDYPLMRGDLLRTGAEVLRRLEAFEASSGSGSIEERIEAAVAARRADSAGRAAAQAEPQAGTATAGSAAAGVAGGNGAARKTADPVEELIASRKRARQESAAGFCPKCGKPFQKSDKFCSKCGKVL